MRYFKTLHDRPQVPTELVVVSLITAMTVPAILAKTGAAVPGHRPDTTKPMSTKKN
jgi:hypothetical protein